MLSSIWQRTHTSNTRTRGLRVEASESSRYVHRLDQAKHYALSHNGKCADLLNSNENDTKCIAHAGTKLKLV